MGPMLLSGTGSHFQHNIKNGNCTTAGALYYAKNN